MMDQQCELNQSQMEIYTKEMNEMSVREWNQILMNNWEITDFYTMRCPTCNAQLSGHEKLKCWIVNIKNHSLKAYCDYFGMKECCRIRIMSTTDYHKLRTIYEHHNQQHTNMILSSFGIKMQTKTNPDE